MVFVLSGLFFASLIVVHSKIDLIALNYTGTAASEEGDVRLR